MTRPMISRVRRLIRLVVAGVLVAGRLAAHEPFDFSARGMAFADRIEITCTLGADAAKQLLTVGGLTPEKIAEALRALSPDAEIEHPPPLADHLFSLTSAGARVPPRGAVSRAEGMEMLLTVTYPRPAPGPLVVDAVGYRSIAGLRAGSLIIVDEVAGTLGAGLLSPGRPRLKLSLPAPPASAAR